MRYLSKDILEEVITQRPSDSYKSNFGRVVLIGGNRQYGGAIIMSTEACINSGAGLTTVITDVKITGLYMQDAQKRWSWALKKQSF